MYKIQFFRTIFTVKILVFICFSTQVLATPNFIVNNDKDLSDTKVGDGICDTTINFSLLNFPSKGGASLNDVSKLDLTSKEHRVSFDGFAPILSGSCTLRAAIEEANALPGLQTILLPRPKYNSGGGHSDDNPSHEYKLTKKQELKITDSVTILGEGKPTINAEKHSRVFSILNKPIPSQEHDYELDEPDLSVVNANTPNEEVSEQLWQAAQEAAEDIRRNGLDFIFDFTVETIQVELNSLDITGGKSTGFHGGAITITGGNIHVKIQDSDIRDSFAVFGGGISLTGGASLLLQDSRVYSNFAGSSSVDDSFGGGGLTQRGGGIFISNNETQAKIDNSIIYDNKAI